MTSVHRCSNISIILSALVDDDPHVKVTKHWQFLIIQNGIIYLHESTE